MNDPILPLQNRLDALDARLAILESRAEATVASAGSMLGRMTSDKKAAAAKKNGASRWAGHVKKPK